MCYTVVFWVSLVSNVIIHNRLSCVGLIIVTFYCAGGAFGRRARERRPEDGLKRRISRRDEYYARDGRRGSGAGGVI